MRKELYLAGGCFWGMEAYFKGITGVIDTSVGYANGHVENPTYEMVCKGDTGFAETIKIIYEDQKLLLSTLLSLYYEVIDPTTYHRQGHDVGSQYRTGMYYVDTIDKEVMEASLVELAKKYDKPIVVECMPLRNFYLAEAYHQDYLRTHPHGYCHISKQQIEKAKQFTLKPVFHKVEKDVLKQMLSMQAFDVTQNNKTETPYHNAYWDVTTQGIYVDVTTGEPLFFSFDKFDAGCGWPSFSKAINQDVLSENVDTSHGMKRIEVRSTLGDAHLGHVFDDGPKKSGGLRYCINSAALRFIAKADMQEAGYGAWLDAFE